MPVKIGISSCLLGNAVRYDGGHKLDHYLRDILGNYVKYVPVCPEVECGLPIPREAMRLVGNPDEPRLMTIRTKIDHTERMRSWSRDKLDELENEDLCGFIFKTKSPSSGLHAIKVYTEAGMPSRRGTGVFAREFTRRFPLIPVEDEGRLHDANLRENFIERIFAFGRWKDFVRDDGSLHGLIEFHADHKLLVMAHSPKHVKLLGNIVSHSKGRRASETVLQTYLETLLEALALIATSRKNVNVLQHIMGYFKKDLTADEKQELLGVIEQYHAGLIPLIVPITLMNHYVRKFDHPYLKRQYYLHPHPAELMLRNHV
jgi:uncharacterized protein YbgA (DUF1722 family)/uncharacterized protein YbbK (DUF523 family)